MLSSSFPSFNSYFLLCVFSLSSPFVVLFRSPVRVGRFIDKIEVSAQRGMVPRVKVRYCSPSHRSQLCNVSGSVYLKYQVFVSCRVCGRSCFPPGLSLCVCVYRVVGHPVRRRCSPLLLKDISSCGLLVEGIGEKSSLCVERRSSCDSAFCDPVNGVCPCNRSVRYLCTTGRSVLGGR